MTSISNGESGLSVRTKLNSSLTVTDAFTVSSGNVGIGATPTLKLDVRGGSIVAGASEMVLYGRSAAGFPSVAFNTGYFALGTNNTDAANGGLSIYTMAASTLSEAMRINTSGNVGIGTSSPTSKLDVVGTANATTLSIGGTAITATAAELNFVDGVTSAIQTQLGTKQETLTGAATTIATSNLTVSRALSSNASGKVVVSTVTDTELAVLSGLTATTAELNYNDITTLGTSQASKTVTADANGDVKFSNAVVETVFALTGTTPALNPTSGMIQTWTLSASSTPTDSLNAGESLTLMIDDGTAYTITWPSVTWKTNGGVAPTLNTTGYTVIVLWKVSTVLYGARVGDA